MNHDSEKWLDDRIDEDVIRMAEKRRKELMESEELKDIEVTMDELQALRKRLGLLDAEAGNDMEAAEEFAPEVSGVKAAEPDVTESVVAESDAVDKSAEVPVKNTEKVRRLRIRLRVALAAALVAVLALGVGMVGSGKKVYLPVVSQREDGDESTTKVNNDETAVESGLDEETVCQEIEDELGVLPIRLGYKPIEMYLDSFYVNKDAGEAFINYKYIENNLHMYISKDISTSSLNYKMDGIETEKVNVVSLGKEIVLIQYLDSNNNTYFQTSFEYLNTYYSLNGMMDKNEFIQILENIWIKNV